MLLRVNNILFLGFVWRVVLFFVFFEKYYILSPYTIYFFARYLVSIHGSTIVAPLYINKVLHFFKGASCFYTTISLMMMPCCCRMSSVLHMGGVRLIHVRPLCRGKDGVFILHPFIFCRHYNDEASVAEYCATDCTVVCAVCVCVIAFFTKYCHVVCQLTMSLMRMRSLVEIPFAASIFLSPMRLLPNSS